MRRPSKRQAAAPHPDQLELGYCPPAEPLRACEAPTPDSPGREAPDQAQPPATAEGIQTVLIGELPSVAPTGAHTTAPPRQAEGRRRPSPPRSGLPNQAKVPASRRPLPRHLLSSAITPEPEQVSPQTAATASRTEHETGPAVGMLSPTPGSDDGQQLGVNYRKIGEPTASPCSLYARKGGEPAGRRRRGSSKPSEPPTAASVSPATALPHPLNVPLNSHIQDAREGHRSACLTLPVLAKMMKSLDCLASQGERAGDDPGQDTGPASGRPADRPPTGDTRPRRRGRRDAPARRAAPRPAGHPILPAAAGEEGQ